MNENVEIDGDVTRIYKLRNKSTKHKLEATQIENKMRESHLRWYFDMHLSLKECTCNNELFDPTSRVVKEIEEG